jgi:hypothetical protein
MTTAITYSDPWATTVSSPTYSPGGLGLTSGMPILSTTPVSTPTIFGRPFDEVRRTLEVGKIVDKGYWIKATGSRVTKSGWTNESDWDYVIFDPGMKLESELMKDGWELGGSGEELDRCFSSLKKGQVNFILVKSEDIWKKWIIATNLIKAMDPKTKEERVGIFDTVFGKTSDSKAMEF